MAFRERFDRYVCEGDSIAVEIDGFRVTARIVQTSARTDSGHRSILATRDLSDPETISASG